MALSLLQTVVCVVLLLGVQTNAAFAFPKVPIHYSKNYDRSRTKSYMVGIRPNATATNVCAGVLVAKNWVLTGGCRPNWAFLKGGFILTFIPHGIPNTQFASIASRFNGESTDGEQNRIRQWIQHPKFNATSGVFNYILFQLYNASSYEPIASPDEALIPHAGDKLETLGWIVGGDANASLTRKEFVMMNDTQCSEQPGVDPSMHCLVNPTAEDACYANVGSPLIQTIKRKDTLLGLVNINHACNSSAVPIVFNDLKSSVRSWIKDIANV